MNWTLRTLIFTIAIAGTFQLLPSDALALTKQDEIGFVIAVQGRISLTSATAIPRPATLRQSVFPHDVIRTDINGQIKILFNDNSILNVTEDSEIEITDFVYDPDKPQRRTILNMLQGRIKAMVAHFAEATSSRFEIHTPTAVAAARGTEYVVWTASIDGEPRTGIAVTDGAVSVTNTKKEQVVVSAGYYTLALHTGRLTSPVQIVANREVQLHIQRSELRTDPTMVEHVKAAMNRHEQLRQQGREALTLREAARLKAEGVLSTVGQSGNDPKQRKTADGLIRGHDQGEFERKQLVNADNPQIHVTPPSVEKVQRAEKVERVERVERLERVERPQRPERPERPAHHRIR